MKIKDRPEYKSKPDVVTILPNSNVSEAIQKMAEKNFGSILVQEKDNTLVGILTERDLLRRLLNQGKDPKKTKVSEIMTKELRCASEDDKIIDWLRIMSNERFRHLPVLNEEGVVVKVMSQGDFVSYTWPQLYENVKEKASETFGISHQVIILIIAMLSYAVLVKFLI